MKQKLFTLFLALAASVGTIFAAKVQIGNLYYNLDATNKTAVVTSQNSDYPYWSVTITTANIPSSVKYESVTYSVTEIGYDAFYECTGLTSVTIPNSVTSIGYDAFYECTGLTSVTIPNSVTSISGFAFEGCSGLTSIEIPNSVTSIGKEAFSGCTNLPVIDNIRYADTYLVGAVDKTLSTYTIKDGTKWIGGSAFYECTGLTSISIPNSVTSIGDWAFGYCTGLTSVTIPNSVTSIGEDAFSGCTGLTSVTIPNSVTSIGDWAFEGCSGLTSIEIPNSVTSIGEGAFSGCTGLTSVTCEASTPPACGSNVFYEVDKSIPLYVPAKSVEAYKAADQWKDFGDNIKPIQAEALDEILESSDTKVLKFIKNGQLYILRDGKLYNAQGARVK